MTSIANLIADKKTIKVRLNNHPIMVTYRPNRVTMGENALLMELSEEGDPLALGERLCRLVCDWDLEGPLYGDVRVKQEDPDAEDDDDSADADDDAGTTRRQKVETVEKEIVAEGEKVPLTPEVIQYMGNTIILTILQKVQEDAAPNPTSRKPTQKR